VPWSALGAVFAAIGVLVGAFGAHALRGRLDAYGTGIYERAVFYQFVHALGLLAVGVARDAGALGAASANLAGALFVIGILVFSGSLYALALTGIRRLGAITPLGGLAFVAGWIAFATGLILVR
jgi:uncharacterized membrane protein YgdD (TMEM256/DUF423 family)